MKKMFLTILAFTMFLVMGNAEIVKAEENHYLYPYQYGGESTVYTGEPTKYFTMMGTKYYHGVGANGLYVDRDYHFNLDRKFTEVTFDLGNVDYKDGLRGNSGTAYIYLDGKVEKEIKVSPGMITQIVTVNTEGKKQLTVDFECRGNTNHDAYYGLGNVIGKGGHFYTVENTIPATPEKEGLRTYICDVCEYSYEETVAPIDTCVPYLHPYQTSDNTKIYKGGEDTFTVMGVKYNYGVRPTHWSGKRIALYNLGQQYNSVTFDVGWTGAGTAYTAGAVLNIYGDNTLLKTVDLNCRMYDQTITVRTPGIIQLKLEFGDSNTQYGIFNMSYEAKTAKSHTFSSKVILEPTKTSTGIKSYTCDDCGASYTKVLDKIVVKKYTATFNKNNGTKLSKSKITVESGKKLGTLPTVVRKGYTFKGWYTKKSGGSKISTSTKLTGNKTYYAQWTKVSTSQVKKLKLTNLSGKKMKVTYDKVSNAKGYQIVYSTSKKFSSSKTKTTTSRNVTFKSLKKGKTYYVKVRAYKLDSMKNKVYGKYSTTVKVKIKK